MKSKRVLKTSAKKLYKKGTESRNSKILSIFLVCLIGTWVVIGLLLLTGKVFSQQYVQSVADKVEQAIEKKEIPSPQYKPLDKATYDQKMISLANYASTTSTTTVRLWPVQSAPYPKDGALLPFNRIIAYYGNLYSTKMGVLGEYEEDVMLAKLQAEVDKWTAADPETPAIPALHYIVTTAQGAPGADGKYRLRMPTIEIDKVLEMAKKINAVVFLDFQVGLSNLQTELPVYETYFKMPNVHLGIDPEFSMKTGAKPGTVIGTMSATDVNYAANYLAKLIKDNNLPPKVLVVHRFTQNMVTNYKGITPLPEVQIVMDMDGWGSGPRKINTYKQFVYAEPVQFTGFKLFYKNDLKEPGSALLTPKDLLKLTPQPIYIQYQ